MSINATLLAQMIVFALLIWFTMKFVWPILLQAMQDRETRISEGLAAAEKGRHDLELAEKRAAELMREGKEKAQEYIVQAQKRADEIVEEAKDVARAEGERLKSAARADMETELNQVRENLRAQVAALAVAGAEQILAREVDVKAHKQMLDKLSASL
ncbi:F0F1 ATP synthase subunit B [Hydrogenophaga sp.]|uniref:F0F1 ATP synthase subunit B n=1 Tax=Hydrogenophaga sp. TaxID=1904254 RepID=UPI00261AEA68|nr:F0F1 ATP synthase subunit B [Hydrogenophaga sp.]MCW5655983.1 F0F1 ATP synthase subunit B [Hydrogenophaga sp.]